MHLSIKKQQKTNPPTPQKNNNKKTNKKTKQKNNKKKLPRSLNNFHIWRLSTLRWAAATPSPHKRNIL